MFGTHIKQLARVCADTVRIFVFVRARTRSRSLNAIIFYCNAAQKRLRRLPQPAQSRLATRNYRNVAVSSFAAAAVAAEAVIVHWSMARHNSETLRPSAAAQTIAIIINLCTN